MNGEECMFSHESLTEDTQELLDKVVIADILNVVVVLLLFLSTLTNITLFFSYEDAGRGCRSWCRR